MIPLERVRKLLKKNNFSNVSIKEVDDIIFLEGEMDSWSDIVRCGMLVSKSKLYTHTVNEIKLKGYNEPKVRSSSINDKALDGVHVDALVIGGGVIGASVLRELTKYKIDALLVEKEEDLAMHQSGRNDGCIHVGVDLHKGSRKLEYLLKSKKILKEVCSNIDIEYKEDGQTVGFKSLYTYPLVKLYLKKKCKSNHIEGMKLLSRKELLKIEPNLSKRVKFGAHFPTAGVICPYNFTIALAESAVINGARVSFKTIVTGMDNEDGMIKAVHTNRGTIYPKIVINCAGVFSDDIAKMANDKYFSIHPRKGTDSLMDKSVTPMLSKTGVQIFDIKKSAKKTNSKGGGIIPTVDKNILVGPDAIEIPQKEDFSTSASNINEIFKKHSNTIEALKKSDIITYFSGIRAASYEEDFIVERGKWCKNIIHAAGIQSPGLSCALGIALDIGSLAASMLNAKKNPSFNPIRKGVIKTRYLSDLERDRLIKRDPRYGHIICRCEEISEGEIVDAIHSVIPPTTIDGIKRRVRAGMGRCQGGFCQPNVLAIYARETNNDLLDICKKGEGRILYRDSKE